MTLSRRQRRQLLRLDRELSADTTLCAVARLMDVDTDRPPPRGPVGRVLGRFAALWRALAAHPLIVLAAFVVLATFGALLAAAELVRAPSPALAIVALVPLYPLVGAIAVTQQKRAGALV
jgi:hypothetical protein